VVSADAKTKRIALSMEKQPKASVDDLAT